MNISEEDVRNLIISYLNEEGLELYDLNLADFPNVSKVEIFIYSPSGLDHKTIERLSYQLQNVLQDSNIERGTYDLLVSSPGIEPILNTARHFELALGKTIKIKTFRDICGEYLFLGTLTAINTKNITMILENDNALNLDIENIKKAKVIYREKVEIGNNEIR